jgi:hypothetical protein
VEGFCVPVNQSKEMRVTSGMAHAWPEVYIEGIGWLPFEPTPGYTNLRYLGWEVRKPQIDIDNEAVESTPTPPAAQQDIKEPEEQSEGNAEGWRTLLKVVCILIPVCLFALLIEKMRQSRAYQKLTVEQKYVVEIKRNLWLLEKAGYKREESETLSELQFRIGKELPELFEEQTDRHFLTGYEEYLYGEKVVSNELLESAIVKKEEILLWLKEENKRYYLWVRLLLFVSGY